MSQGTPILKDLKRQGLSRSDRSRVAGEHAGAALARIAGGFGEGEAPGPLLRQLAGAVDQLVVALYGCAEVPPSARISLIALGGYGRGELFPHSDLDLLVVCEGEQEELATRIVECVVYPLWDAGMAVGHAVRGIDETLQLALEDLTVRTSLLDARLLCGDEGPFHALEAGGLRQFFGPQKVGEFVTALREERARRHRRFGETEYLLEPNVKQGKGGLRDLNTGLWAAKARFGVTELERLASVGAGTQRQVRALSEALAFLQRLRLAMHLEAGRAQDHLLFELQEALAPRLFPEVELPGVKRRAAEVEPAVERLMHAFYRHARTVVLESDGILERCSLVPQAAAEGPSSGTPATERTDEHFVVTGRRISSSEPDRFWDEPAEILRAFQLVHQLRLPLDRPTQDAIAEAVADVPGTRLPADERAAERWIELLCSPEQPGEGTLLEEMHHLGVIGALIPEFEPCTGRIQHDLYHVYTVDLHSLYVVALLKAWRRGELAERFPTPVAIIARLERLRGLMLAALLHDVGKPLGHGHAATGARLAAGVAARLGLAGAELEEVRFLVHNHLLMAHLSQRRDLSDPAVVASFAAQVETVNRLRQLYLLTAADTAMTAPGNLTEWKATLLDELFIKTYLFLTHGSTTGHLAEERAQELAERRDALELVLRRRLGPTGVEWIARVPEEMLLAFPVEDLAHHIGVAVELEGEADAVLRLATRPREGGASELTVCCGDSPGRLATITGVMLMHRIEVLAAQVFTLERGHQLGDRLVLDIFVVQPPALEPSDPGQPSELWQLFGDDLERAVRGELSVDEQVRRRLRPSGLPRRVTPRVRTEVTVDNNASDRFTVIDVQAPDRLGVLHAITRTLSEHGLTIHLSKVASEAGRVVDIFYVSDGETGDKVTDRARLDQVRRSVSVAIQQLEPARTGSETRSP